MTSMLHNHVNAQHIYTCIYTETHTNDETELVGQDVLHSIVSTFRKCSCLFNSQGSEQVLKCSTMQKL